MARCFVVSLMRGGFKHYLKRIETREQEGAPLPLFVGFFSVDLLEAQKFLKIYEAHYKNEGGCSDAISSKGNNGL